MNKVNVLIVEDQCENLTLLKSIIRDDSIEAKSVQTVLAAQDEILKGKIDLLITDIFVPNDIGENINEKGGVELLDWVTQIQPQLRPARVIGLTSQMKSYTDNLNFFNSKGCLLLKSDMHDSKWIEPIRSTCDYLYTPNVDVPTFSLELKSKKYDVVLLTALGHNELKSIHDLPVEWSEFRVPNDPSIYYEAEVSTVQYGIKKLLSLHAPRMGMSSSASITTKVIEKFSPEYLIMTGIAAGVEGKCNLGDILAAETCWDWGNGKQTQIGEQGLFKPAPHQETISNSLRSIIQKVRNKSLYVDSIYREWRGSKPKTPLNLVFGPMASGAVVLEDPSVMDTIITHNRETIGIDMEAYGVISAAQITTDTPPRVLILKSACDFANPQKNDDWQDYASYTSAQLAFNLIVNDLPFTD